MKKFFGSLIAITAAVALLTGCCSHEWTPADCGHPATCSVCGATKGSPVGEHEWHDADCTHPKTCAVCGETDGEPLGHRWSGVTCEQADTCEVCGTVNGEPKGHDWTTPTCDVPRVCRFCGKSDGQTASHEWEEATCSHPKRCVKCGKTVGEPLEHKFSAVTCRQPATCTVCGYTDGVLGQHDFGKDGTCKICGELPRIIPTEKMVQLHAGIPFYAAVCFSAPTLEELTDNIDQLSRNGIAFEIYDATCWGGFLGEEKYVVVEGSYDYENFADIALKKVKKVFPDAYTAYSGSYITPEDATSPFDALTEEMNKANEESSESQEQWNDYQNDWDNTWDNGWGYDWGYGY